MDPAAAGKSCSTTLCRSVDSGRQQQTAFACPLCDAMRCDAMRCRHCTTLAQPPCALPRGRRWRPDFSAGHAPRRNDRWTSARVPLACPERAIRCPPTNAAINSVQRAMSTSMVIRAWAWCLAVSFSLARLQVRWPENAAKVQVRAVDASGSWKLIPLAFESEPVAHVAVRRSTPLTRMGATG